MHCLPMHEILRLIEKHRLSIREVLMDLWTGNYGSHTFFGVNLREGISEFIPTARGPKATSSYST
jgi:hypothetical protein